jgi:hypothetical protein
MVTASELRKPSFWSLQAAGWFCFFLLSTLVVFPYLWKPGELGYQSSKALFLDQCLMCFLCFVASLSLRFVCRALLQRSLSWVTLEIWAASCSVVVGTLTALTADLFLIGRPETIELLEACAKTSALLFLWCNLYFGIKQSHRPLRQTQGARGEQAASQPRETGRYASRLTIRSGPKIQVVCVDDVEWIAAAGDYTELHARNVVHLLRETMNSLEKRLDPSKFARIHRSKIVSLACILELRTIDNREYIFRLSDGSQHRSSRTYADRIDSWIGSN